MPTPTGTPQRGRSYILTSSTPMMRWSLRTAGSASTRSSRTCPPSLRRVAVPLCFLPHRSRFAPGCCTCLRAADPHANFPRLGDCPRTCPPEPTPSMRPQVQPVAGTAVLWRNCHRDGSVDVQSVHAGADDAAACARTCPSRCVHLYKNGKTKSARTYIKNKGENKSRKNLYIKNERREQNPQ